MTYSETFVSWLDNKKIAKNNKTLADLRTKCDCEDNTLQETKRQNMKHLPATHTAIGQVNIVIIKRGLVQENILEA